MSTIVPLITLGAHPRPPAALLPNFPLSHINDPRRTVSNPSIPSSTTVIIHPASERLRQLGQLPLFSSDVHSDANVVRELASLAEAQLTSLDTSLERARALQARAHERLQTLEQRHESYYQSMSAGATYEAALETVRALEASKEALENALKRHKGLLHPIRRLPPELLEQIMQFTVENEERDRRNELLFWHDFQLHSRSSTRSNPADSEAYPSDSQQLRIRRHWHRRIPSPLSLSLVCAYWRDVACKKPSLWTTVHFQLSGQPNVGMKSWDRVRLFLARAGQDPSMSLVFTGWEEHGHPPSDASFRKVMKLLLSIPDPAAREWSAETPGHSRRTSLVDSASNNLVTLTPLPADMDFTKLVPSPPIDPEPSSHFRIKRFEMVFDTLCEHRNPLGVNRNAEMKWPSTCPKPEEVAFIAKDGVYQPPPHPTDELPPLQTPPYASSLIPWAKEVTLCNLRYRWSIPSSETQGDGPSAYSNLTSLTLLFTRHFPTLLEKPQSSVELGFLQFLKAAPNLQNLEVRLSHSHSEPTASLSNLSTPSSMVATLPQANGSAGPVIAFTHSALAHLAISLQDLFTILPLFLPDGSGTNAPVILLPSLHHLTLLSHRPGPSTHLPQRDEATQMAQRLVHFLELTESKVTHLEFAPWCGPHVVPKDGTGPPEVSVSVDESVIKAQRREIEFSLRQFHSCETLEVSGNDMTSDVIDILRIDRAPPFLSTAAATSLPARAEPPLILQSEPLPSTSIPSPLVHLDGLSGSPNVMINRPNPSEPAASHKRSKRRSILGPKQIIAKVIAAATPSKRRSLALVGTPEQTPRITVNELPLEPDERSPGRSIDGSSRRLDVSRPLSIGSAEQSSTRIGSPSGSGQRVAVTPPSVDSVDIQKGTLLLNLNKLIVHDASRFDRTMITTLEAWGLQVETFG